MKKLTVGKVTINILFVLMSICFLLPFFIILMISISKEADVLNWGYRIIPMHIDFTAYKALFSNWQQVLTAILISLFSTVGGTTLLVIVNAMMAYPLSQPAFRKRGLIMAVVIFTMIFSAGVMPSYIINTRWLHLGNNLLIYILPGLANAWTIILFRTFFMQIPPSLIEAAAIDGATEFQILKSVIIPQSKAIVGMVFVNNAIAKWNDWTTPLYYITDKRLYNIQYLMQKILNEASFLKQQYLENPQFGQNDIPVETLRFAMCVIAVVPILLFFPFAQKYFAKGVSVGSVKE